MYRIASFVFLMVLLLVSSGFALTGFGDSAVGPLETVAPGVVRVGSESAQCRSR